MKNMKTNKSFKQTILEFFYDEKKRDRDTLEHDLLEAIDVLRGLIYDNETINDLITIILNNYKNEPCYSLEQWLSEVDSLIYQNMSVEDQNDIDVMEQFGDDQGNILNDVSETVHQTSGQRRAMKIRRKTDLKFKKKIMIRIKKNKNLCSKNGPYSTWSAKEKRCVYKNPVKSAVMSILARMRRQHE